MNKDVEPEDLEYDENEWIYFSPCDDAGPNAFKENYWFQACVCHETSVSSREFPTPGIPGKKLQKFFPRKTISREFPKNSRKTLFYLMNFVNHGGLYNFL